MSSNEEDRRRARFDAWLDRMTGDGGSIFEWNDDVYKRYEIAVPTTTNAEKVKKIPVVFKLLPQTELAAARRDAREFMASNKLDPEKDRDIFSVIDTVAIIARATRDAIEPYGQYRTLSNFLTTFKSTKIHLAIADAYKMFEAECDPRPDDLPRDVFHLMIKKIAEAGHLGPLVAIDGPAQSAFVLRLVAETLERSQTP